MERSGFLATAAHAQIKYYTTSARVFFLSSSGKDIKKASALRVIFTPINNMITQLVLCKIFCIKACSYYQIIRLIRVTSGNITCVLSWDTLNASGIFLDDTFHALQRCPVSWGFKVCEHQLIFINSTMM